MGEIVTSGIFFVVKSDDLVALNYLPRIYPSPSAIEWIDRGTNRKLSPTRLDQLFRTYHRQDPSPGILKLRSVAGIRLSFEKEAQRAEFAALFEKARQRQRADRARFLTAIYSSMDFAESASDALVTKGVPQEAIAMMWHVNRFLDADFIPPAGHRKRRVFAGVSAGGVAAAALGTAILLIPGVGPVAATGAVLASTYSSVATACGIIGATCAAMANMLTDKDVEEIAVNYLEEQLRRGRVFLSVDHEGCDLSAQAIGELMETNGGRLV